MASSRRTSPAQLSRQEEWAQEPNEGIVAGDLRMQKDENQRDGDRRRGLSEITWKHLERVINMMIPFSAGSSLHSAESAPANSIISQPTEKSIEGTEFKQEREKQMIVHNYYINGRREGWKQVEKSEIPPNVLDNKMEGELAEIPPSRLGNDMHKYSGEISPEKLGKNIFNTSSGKEEESRHLDKDRKILQRQRQSQGGFMNKKQKHRTCHHHQHTIPITRHQTDIQETRRRQQC